MTIRIGILSIKGPDYHPTRRLSEAAKSCGAEAVVIDPYTLDLSYREGKPVFLPSERTDGLDAVLPRQGAEIKTASLAVIAHFEDMGIPVINGLAAIQKARNKYITLQTLAAAGLIVPRTIYATSIHGCHLARRNFAPLPAVLKPISGRQGTGIHCLAPDAALPEDVVTELEARRGILVQAYIAPKGRKDVRALVVNGRVVGAVLLTPQHGDFRANVHQGGQIEAFTLPTSMAQTACRAVRAVGLTIAGVDLIIPSNAPPKVMEVNYSPGFKGFEAATGIDAAGLIIEHVLSVIAEHDYMTS